MSPPGKHSSGTRVFFHQEVVGGHLGTSGMKKTELELLGEHSATLGHGHRGTETRLWREEQGPSWIAHSPRPALGAHTQAGPISFTGHWGMN